MSIYSDPKNFSKIFLFSIFFLGFGMMLAKGNATQNNNKLSELLKNKEYVFCGEGYLFELERRGFVQIGSYVPIAVIDHPEAVKNLHRELAHCGSDIIEAFTYYGHREKLKLIGKEDMLEELNRKALRLAREVADEFPGTLMAGNVSNSNIWDHKDIESQKQVENNLREQIRWAKEEGADFIIGETFSSLGEARMALKISNEFGLESVITLAIQAAGNMLEGNSPAEACQILADEGAAVVGLNCTRGPATMLPILEDICKTVKSVPIAALPVIYNTTPEKPTMQQLTYKGSLYMDLEPHICTRYDVAYFAQQAAKLGVKYLGICCGGGPYHLRAMVEALGKKTNASKYSADLSKHFAIREYEETVRSKHFFG